MSTTRLIRVAFCIVALAGWAAPDLAADELLLRVSPAVGRAPASVIARVWVARQDDNRLLRVTIDSGSYLRSSDLVLPGAGAAQSHTLRWTNLPSGDYVVTVELYGSSSVKTVVSRRLQIIG